MSLAVADLAYGFPQRRVGAGISFVLETGEALAVLGPNGSGKTTLFRTLLGLLPSQGGSIAVEAKPLGQWSARDLARTLAYVPQAHVSYFPFYVRDVVLMGRTAHLGLFATPGAHDREVADACLRTLRIDHLAGKLYTEISGGERQLALIARALASEARMLVMDEPTANLDFGNQALILEEIRRLKAGGHGVLFCTHDPDHAFLCADRVLLLKGGATLALGPPATVVTAENLLALYGVQVAVGADGTRHVRICPGFDTADAPPG